MKTQMIKHSFWINSINNRTVDKIQLINHSPIPITIVEILLKTVQFRANRIINNTVILVEDQPYLE